MLFLSCRDSNIPFNNSSYEYTNNPDDFDEDIVSIDKINIGEVRDLYFFNNRLFVAT